ncbi:putative esterase [Xylariaceae sp. FL0804]|nr:putative esterase [Xylariaceae sp. FL0804]
MPFETKAVVATFGGKLLKLSHQSSATGTPMSVYVFLPPAAFSDDKKKKLPVLIYLSGLTCTPDNCAEKGFFHAAAARRGLAVVYPDTSPRHTDADGAKVAGEDDAYDLGSGAGFYVDATREPWAGGGYKMETYVARELPSLLFGSEGGGGDPALLGAALDADRVSITGHSMGGHGALSLFLRHPGAYRSVSALAPICNPTACAWGQKAFSEYFGPEDKEEAKRAWREHDASELIKTDKWRGKPLDVLVDVGTGDNFYKQGQLLPENLQKAAEEAGVDGVKVRFQPDYDHSYFFISTFAEDHVNHAAKYLL